MSTAASAGGHDHGMDRRHRIEETARHEVVDREQEKYGGMKFGAAFFGWLAATGLFVLLVAVAAAVTAAIGAATGALNQATSGSAQNLTTAGIWSAVVLLVIWFVAYFGGGYVAGRMARFSGVKQGIAVWLWMIAIGIILAIIGAIAGQNLMSTMGGMPSLNIDPTAMTWGSIISLLLVLAVSLGGAVLGGRTGMHYHRKVDRTGFGD